MRPFALGLIATALLGGTPAVAAPIDNFVAIEDELLCKTAGVGVDGPALLDFLRQRTPNPALCQQIGTLIQKLDDNRFDARQAASQQLIAHGTVALPQLRTALVGASLETTRRAEKCIQEIERTIVPGLSAAAVHLVTARKPEGAVEALFAYLPYADDSTVEEEVLGALLVLGVRDGRPDPLLTAALKDRVPARRAAAALVVGRYGTVEEQKEVFRLLADGDSRVCFRAAQGLIAARDKQAVAALVSLLSGAPIDLAVQAEDLLGRVAGDKAPSATLTDATAAVRKKCRDAWDMWWKANEGKIDLAKADVDLLSESTPQRVRELARRFKDALVKGDSATLQRLSDAPFYWFHIDNSATREQLMKFWTEKPTGGLERLDEATYTFKNVVSVEEFTKVGSQEAKDFLSKFRKDTIRVVFVDVIAPGGDDEMKVAALVRIGAQPRIIGVSLVSSRKRN
ncbi:MAG: hypothetical protein K2R98_23215 [Gemmataceae bacterium]|nr:hypothetical protein [Gemmataceae bacterium]